MRYALPLSVAMCGSARNASAGAGSERDIFWSIQLIDHTTTDFTMAAREIYVGKIVLNVR